jgi:hypothetical protein
VFNVWNDVWFSYKSYPGLEGELRYLALVNFSLCQKVFFQVDSHSPKSTPTVTSPNCFHPPITKNGMPGLLEVILDLVLGPSARSRRDQASTPRDSRWDEIISHPRQPRFHSRSWVEIKSVRRNYSCTYGYGTYIDVRTPSRTSHEQWCRDRDVCLSWGFSDLVSGCSIKNRLYGLLILPHLDTWFRFLFLIPLQITQRSRIGHTLEIAATSPDLQFHFFPSQKMWSTNHLLSPKHQWPKPHRPKSGHCSQTSASADLPHLPGCQYNQGEPLYHPPCCQ